MSSIILHDKTNNDWNSLGFGPLVDAMNPKVTREKHGIYDLQFQYPVNGPLFNELKIGRWIVSDAGPTIVSQAQRFEIATISKPIDGIVTVYCEHKRYQLLRTIVKVGEKMSTTKAQLALNRLLQLSEPKSDFTYFSDVQTDAGMDFSDPAKFENVQSALGGVRGSILDNFGGEYLFDNNKVSLLQSAGKESNVIIAYGKNLTDITQEESIESTYTSVYGWAKDEEGKVITLPETYIDSEYVGSYTQRRIQMKDFSDEAITTAAQLRTAVQNFIKNNKIGVPKVSIKAKYEELSSSVNAENLKLLESIDLCDYVTISFNQLGINTSAQIVKTVWNVGLDKYDSVELGDARTDFAKVIEDNKTDTGQIEDKLGWLEDAQNEASDILNNPGKGNVVIYPSLADPQEILIMDTKDINTARNIWKWNAGGLGFSSTGYNGTYGLAMTNNGAIVADRITTGTLRAIDIVGVTISGATVTGGKTVTEGENFTSIIEDGKITWTNNQTNQEFFQIKAGEVRGSNNGNTIGIRPMKGDSIFLGQDEDWYGSEKSQFRFSPDIGTLNAEMVSDKYSTMGGTVNFKAHGVGSKPNIAYSKEKSLQLYMDASESNPNIRLGTLGTLWDNNGSGTSWLSDLYFNNIYTELRTQTKRGTTFLNEAYIFLTNGGSSSKSSSISISADASVHISTKAFTVGGGTKNATVRTENYGDRLLNSYETAEVYFADYGEAVTDEMGKVRVDIDPVFAETIVTSRYMVFLTPTQLTTCAVTHEDTEYFIIETEKPNVLVRWNLVAHRLDFQDLRLQEDDNIQAHRFDNESRMSPDEEAEFEEGYRNAAERKRQEKASLYPNTLGI